MNNHFNHKGSPLRQLMAKGKGVPYVSADDLETARAQPDMYAILEGDDGGTIYVTVPASMIFCTEETLHELLREIDGLVWKDNDEDMKRITYEPHKVGDRVAGGMGGGSIEPGVWIHNTLEQYRDAIESVLAGVRVSIYVA